MGGDEKGGKGVGIVHIKNLLRVSLICLALFGLLGCAGGAPLFHSNLMTQENADLFSGPEALQAAYDQVTVNRTKLAGLEGLGFKLGKGMRLGSSKAYEWLHKSEPQINVVVRDAKEYAETQKRIAGEKAGLEAYVFAYKNISGTESRVYVSEKKTTATGWDCQYLFIVKDGVVIHKEYDKKCVSESKSNSAFFQGLIGPAMGAVRLGMGFL